MLQTQAIKTLAYRESMQKIQDQDASLLKQLKMNNNTESIPL